MKHLTSKVLLPCALLLLGACKKDISEQSAANTQPAKSEAEKFQNLYFDLRSNPTVKIPKTFSSMDEVVSFYKQNFRQVDDPATIVKNYNINARTEDDDPVQTVYYPGSSGMVQPVDISNEPVGVFDGSICDGFISGYFEEYNFTGVPSSINGAQVLLENIPAPYPQRGIICVLSFSVKYAPTPIGNFSNKFTYAKASLPPKLTITGGALGTIEQPDIEFNLYANGTGNISGRTVETRTRVITTKDEYVFKAGGAENYPVGATLESGEIVKSSVNSLTTYLLTYGLQYFDYSIDHGHTWTWQWECQYGTLGRPILAYTDQGSVIIGVPQN